MDRCFALCSQIDHMFCYKEVGQYVTYGLFAHRGVHTCTCIMLFGALPIVPAFKDCHNLVRHLLD